MPYSVARRILGVDKIIRITVHSVDEASKLRMKEPIISV